MNNVINASNIFANDDDFNVDPTGKIDRNEMMQAHNIVASTFCQEMLLLHRANGRMLYKHGATYLLVSGDKTLGEFDTYGIAVHAYNHEETE